MALDVLRFHLKDSIYKDHMETYLWYLTINTYLYVLSG